MGGHVNPVRKLARAILIAAPDPVRRGVMTAMGRSLPPRPVRVPTPQAPVDPDAVTFNASYTGPRQDLVDRLPMTCRNVLDLGCATGEVGVAVQRRIPEARVTGIELDPAMAAVAASRIDRVVVTNLEDVEAVTSTLAGERFDGVIAGDILEHLVDPWTTLRGLTAVLASEAWIVASLPNIGFWDTWWNVVVRRRWPYRARGIHDATHLRFFARRNLAPLFKQAGFRIEEVIPKYRIVEHGHRWNRRAAWFAIPGLRDLLTFQFVVIARREPTDSLYPNGPVGLLSELMPPRFDRG